MRSHFIALLATFATLGLASADQAQFDFSKQVFEVFEEDGEAQITVQLSRPATGNQTKVEIELTPGSATPDADYDPTTLVAEFPNDATQATVLIPIVDDGFLENDEQVHLRLRKPNGAGLGRDKRAELEELLSRRPLQGWQR